MQLPSESALIADIRYFCPELFVRPIREFGKDYANVIGVWTGGEGDMPDGTPIFNSLEDGSGNEWCGHVHKGFSAWLESRGWYVESYDEGTFHIVPIGAIHG